MKNIITTIKLMLLAASTIPFCYAESLKNYVPGFYTEWEVSEDSGDVSGIELFIFQSYHGPFIVFSLAEGEPGHPELIKASKNGKKLEFNALGGTYTAQFTPDGLTLSRDGFDRHLKKGSLLNSKDSKVKNSYIPGLYSEWEAAEGSDDIDGSQLFIFNSYHGPHVVLNLVDGEPSLPELIKARQVGNSLQFDASGGTYTGQFTPDGLRLNGNGFDAFLKKMDF